MRQTLAITRTANFLASGGRKPPVGSEKQEAYAPRSPVLLVRLRCFSASARGETEKLYLTFVQFKVIFFPSRLLYTFLEQEEGRCRSDRLARRDHPG